MGEKDRLSSPKSPPRRRPTESTIETPRTLEGMPNCNQNNFININLDANKPKKLTHATRGLSNMANEDKDFDENIKDFFKKSTRVAALKSRKLNWNLPSTSLSSPRISLRQPRTSSMASFAMRNWGIPLNEISEEDSKGIPTPVIPSDPKVKLPSKISRISMPSMSI